MIQRMIRSMIKILNDTPEAKPVEIATEVISELGIQEIGWVCQDTDFKVLHTDPHCESCYAAFTIGAPVDDPS